MKKTYSRISILVILLILLILYLLNANLIIKNTLSYTTLFIEKLFPASLIFFTFSSLLIDYGFIEFITTTLHLNGSKIYLTIMSLISGFPSGAKYTKELLEKNLITEKEANYYITYTHFPNPLFILGTVNKLIQNTKYTNLLLLSILLGNFITSIIYKTKTTNLTITQLSTTENFSSSLSKAIISSLKTILIIYGTSLFFYLIATIINHYLVLSTYPYIILNGFFDLTKGVTSTTLITNNIHRALLIITFISLGGLSIHMQVKSILADTKINYKKFFYGRIISTITAILLFLLFINIF